MADQLEELPLLPLSTVLFPYGQVRLHIFEERHQSMVRDCFDYDRPFGIVMIRNGDESDENPDLTWSARPSASTTYTHSQTVDWT